MTRYIPPSTHHPILRHFITPTCRISLKRTMLRCVGMLGVWYVVMGLFGCRPILRTQEQLRGAPPTRDLIAAYVLDQLKTLPAQQFSVGGVRLGDPQERVFDLWGRPTRQTAQRSTWGDADGNPLYSVLWKNVITRANLRAPLKQQRLVATIDLFPACASLLHPDNRPLLSDAIRQSTYRNKLFAALSFPQHTRLAKRFLYLQRGWAVVLFSDLLPSQQKIPYVVRLFLENSRTPLRQGTSQTNPVPDTKTDPMAAR